MKGSLETLVLYLKENIILIKGPSGFDGLHWAKVTNHIHIFKIYLFLAVLGLRCCSQAFSSCGKQGLLFIAARGFLIAVASLVAVHGLQ